MNVVLDTKGKLTVLSPTSKVGNFIKFLALQNLIVGLTACSSEGSNGGTFKPIQYFI